LERRLRRWGPRVALAAAFALAAADARADVEIAPGQKTMWRDQWPSFRAEEGALTAGAVLGTAALLANGPAAEPRWTGGVLFDDAVRSALRIESEAGRARAARIGDLTYYGAAVIPFAVDVLLVSLAIRRDTTTAYNVAMTNLEAFAYSGLLSFVSTTLSARERPEATGCLAAGGGERCNLESRTESFFSGHTTISATSAGLVCAHHAHVPLWGGGAADAAACGLAGFMTVVTGTSRVMADRHYASDVLAGGAVGFSVGYLVPTLLRYRGREGARVRVGANVPGAELGLSVSAVF